MMLKDLGQRIRVQREKRGLKQNDVASALQISPQAVSKWERGENAPDIAVLGDLAKLLGVSVDWLLGRFAETRDVFAATVLFCGVQKAREKSESLRPQDFALWSNGICYQVTEAVLGYEGVPVKYVGPGILCFFSGPEHEARALRAALGAQAASAEALKIGISSGEVYLGAIGHPDYARPDIMGEPVSIAMLCMKWASGNTRSGLAVSAATAEKARREFSLGKQHRVKFPGISHPTGVFELRGTRVGK